MDLKLKGRAFIVTGGSKGIGGAIVKTLLAEGAHVTACARNFAPLKEMQDILPGDIQKNLIIQTCDVCVPDSVEHVVKNTMEQVGRLDGIVANAGAGSKGNALHTPLREWISQYELKIAGILNLLQAALPGLRGSDAGRIVIMNGVTANVPNGEMAAVSAARAAVGSLSNMLAAELAADKICVNTINLGAIDTERQKTNYKNSSSALPYESWSQNEAKRRGIPFGRFGTVEEVAPIAAFLLSPLASYITASSIDVSGGLHAKV